MLLLPLALALQAVAADASVSVPRAHAPAAPDTGFRAVLQAAVAGAVDTTLAARPETAAPGAPSLQRLRDLAAGRAPRGVDTVARSEPALGPCPQYAMRIIRPDTSVHHTLRIARPANVPPMPVMNPCALGVQRVASPPPPPGGAAKVRVWSGVPRRP